ncbi:MAG TPA: hydroxysqualene dehydroxylase HpnE [Bryobacteraceae bacterium]|nr:hydroxysqualene dehydroxylase HpnE [Bryobacteraceae bacterium]
MPRIVIIGGGLAGLAAAAALGGSGNDVELYESRPFLGGRAASYPVSTGEHIDNCQHILLRCCVNLLDFYRRLGVEESIRFHRDFFFIEPGGRTSILKAGVLPAPLHFSGSFAGLSFLGLADKFAVASGLLAIRRERKTRKDLDKITMLEWLREKRQTPRAIERFWRQVLVSAVNEELDRMAASHGFQVFWLGFLAGSRTYEMGIPAVPLGELYRDQAWSRLPGVRLVERCTVDKILFEGESVRGVLAGGQTRTADLYISALPFERMANLAPALGVEYAAFTHSPITGIHLWFDRPVTDLPHATLLDRTVQWFFNKEGGRYLMLVVSASRSLTAMPRQEVLALATRELAEFLPLVKQAKVVKAHVVKEIRATYSACPGLEAKRPGNRTRYRNFFLAGDWTRTGWPATMEGAVRSGYLAAEAATGQSFVLPDIA